MHRSSRASFVLSVVLYTRMLTWRILGRGLSGNRGSNADAPSWKVVERAIEQVFAIRSSLCATLDTRGLKIRNWKDVKTRSATNMTLCGGESILPEETSLGQEIDDTTERKSGQDVC